MSQQKDKEKIINKMPGGWKKDFVSRFYKATNIEVRNKFGGKYVYGEIRGDTDDVLEFISALILQEKKALLSKIREDLLTMKQPLIDQSSYSTVTGRCAYCGDISGEQYNQAIDDIGEKLAELSNEELEEWVYSKKQTVDKVNELVRTVNEVRDKE